MLSGARRRRLLLLAGLLLGQPAAAQELNIMTGDPSGTDIRIGRDIAAMDADCGIGVGVLEGTGGIENMQAVRDRHATQLAIVQSDVLQYFQTFRDDDPAVRRTAQGIRVAFPLYDDEVQVLARADIADLAGLAGKRVAIGPRDSGTYVTASLVLDLARVAPGTELTLAPDAALAALLAGDIDAMFYVAGAPTALFESEGIDAARFHLLPLADPALRAAYAPKRIEAGTYRFQPDPVEVVAVRAIMVTYDYAPGRNSYQQASCSAIATTSRLLLDRLGELRRTGHPKWRDVDLTASPPDWTVSDCVLRGLDPAYAFACHRPDGTVVQEGGLPGDAPDANRLYLQRVCARVGC